MKHKRDRRKRSSQLDRRGRPVKAQQPARDAKNCGEQEEAPHNKRRAVEERQAQASVARMHKARKQSKRQSQGQSAGKEGTSVAQVPGANQAPAKAGRQHTTHHTPSHPMCARRQGDVAQAKTRVRTSCAAGDTGGRSKALRSLPTDKGGYIYDSGNARRGGARV